MSSPLYSPKTTLSTHVVGIADMWVTSDPDEVIVTYALGSCLGITIYDPVPMVGGLLHVMLPDSHADSHKAVRNPAMFVDTGLPELFREAYRRGADRNRLIIKAVGGASTGTGPDSFQIGKRNFLMLRKLLWKNGLVLKGHDVGGTASRTLSLDAGTGVVTVSSRGRSKSL